MGLLRGALSGICCLFAASAFSGVVSPELESVIRRSPDATIDVVCYVSSPPSHLAARKVKEEFAPELRHFGSRAKELARIAQDRPLNLLEQANRTDSLQAIDDLLNERGARIAEALREESQGILAGVRNAIESYGGIASDDSYILASVRGRLTASQVHDLAQHPSITYVDIHIIGGPLLDNQKASLGVSVAGGFWVNNIDGGIFDVGLIDTGVQRNHPAFAVLSWEGEVTDPDGHGTGVGGMMFSNNATYRGLAFGLETVSVQFANIGMRESTDWLLTQTVQRPEAINVSWGGQTPDTNEYQAIEAWYDSAVDAFDVTFGQAAGNEGGSGYNSLVYPAKAYNTIAVANMYDQDTVTRTDDAITASSSRGPTPAGRKKPDVTAPGHNTWSTTRTLGFGNLGGTSSAAPKVTSAAVLLRDFGLTSSLEDKAVLINSADAWSDANTVESSDDGPALGSHWSRTYGWGYLDLLTAYNQAPYVIQGTFTRPIIVGTRRTAYYSGQRGPAFKSTLVWNRHVGPYTGEDPVEHHSLTNFNLYLYNAATGSSVSQSVSTADNVEQVGTVTTGAAVLKVQTTGTWDIDVPNEDYALAVPGLFTQKDPPAFTVTVGAPDYAVVGSEISVTSNITNVGELSAFDVLASVNAVVVGGNNPTQLGDMAPGAIEPANWAVQVAQSPGVQEIRVEAESASYGETFSNTGSKNVTIIPFFLAPTSYTRVRGTHVSGDLSSVTTSNNVHLMHRPGVVFTTLQWPVELIFTGTASTETPGHFYVRAESNGTSTSIRQKVDAYNYVTGAWVELSNASVTPADSTLILRPPGALSQYVQPGTRQVRIRVSAKTFGPVLTYPWTHRLDQVGWHIAN